MINDIWCSSMGDYPNLVSFLNNQVYEYSTTMNNEIFSLILLKMQEKKWCSSMGYTPSMVSFFLNCVQILKLRGRLGGRFPSFQLLNGTIQWENPEAWMFYCSIVSRYSSMGNSPSLVSLLLNCVQILFNEKFPKLGFFIAQLCLDTLQWA